jgi:ATP-dependent Clp protease ATP-binding subunit ClpB
LRSSPTRAKFAAGLKNNAVADRTGKTWLGRVGYDPVYGARHLKRAIQRYLQDPLVDMLLRGGIPDGATVQVGEGDGGLELGIS